MPRTIRRPSTFRGSRQRPGGGWSRFTAGSTVAAASTKALVGAFNLSNVDIGETTRRTIGEIWTFSDQAATTETFTGAFGLIVATSAAITAGAASLPGPVTERSDNGWLVWQGFQGGIQFATSVGFQSNVGKYYAIDSRAMRKVQEGYGIAVMMETTSSSDGVTLNTNLSMYSTRTQR